MSSHALDNQMNERLIKELEDLKKQVRDLRTMQAQGADAVNLTQSPVQTQSMTLTDNSAGFFWFDLDNADNRTLFSMFEFSLFQGTPSLETMIGYPLNNYADLWEIWHHSDFAISDGNNVREVIWVRNKTGATQTITAWGTWRYLIATGTGSSSTT